MTRPIDSCARQVIFNVYLYFLSEANRFERIEDGYFQKVQARVADACCVSKRFIQNLLKEIDDKDKVKRHIGGRRKPKNVVEPAVCKKDVCSTRQLTAATPSAGLLQAPVTQTSPPPLAPLVTKLPKQPDIPQITPITINEGLPPPPLTRFIRSLPSGTTLLKNPVTPSEPPPLIRVPNRMPPLYRKPQPVMANVQSIVNKNVSPEYSTCDFDCDVTVKCEKLSDSEEFDYE